MAVPRTKRQTNREPKPDPITIQGTIQRTRFHNQTNGYCIISIEVNKELAELITGVGYMPSIREGDEFTFTGVWKNHPKFGRQFVFDSFELILPQSRKGIISYLATLAYGVGWAKATKIVDTLGENCLELIKEDPGVLGKVQGITPEQAGSIVEKLNENVVLAELSALICKEGVTPRLAAQIYNQYGAESLDVVKNNPYILSDEMYRVGFVTADKVAQAVGVLPDSPYRIEAALEFALKSATEDGHCYLPPQELIVRIKKILGKGCGVTTEDIKAANRSLVAKGRTVFDGGDGYSCIYLKGMYEAEVRLAERMRLLLGQKVEVEKNLAGKDIDSVVSLAEKVAGVEYAPEQREAIKTVLGNPLSVITGGPGVGKSTVTKGILVAYEELYPDNNIYLASPTGRAAKRLAEVTGNKEAKTIHRLLEYHPEEGFRINEYNQLQGPGLLIVDEFSMADMELSADLFTGIPTDLQVVLVGDVDQLPSVGPGSVLRDTILSGVVPTVRLQYNYRQEQGSKIAEYADMIRRGIVPPLKERDGDMECIFVDGADEVVPKVSELIWQITEEGYKVTSFQILSPMYKGPAGVSILNEVSQRLINPPSQKKTEYKRGKEVFRLGDKVMVIGKNFKNKGVFNGDIGIVTEIEDKNGPGGSGVWVKFDHLVFFTDEETFYLTLAYTGTVHKSQGSEFPLCVVICVRSHYIMLQRNLLYTGWTRAKQRLVLVCQEEAVRIAVENDKILERFSRLRERLSSGT